MSISTKTKAQYTSILKSELKLALGCTEPIAIAYCAACARRVLGEKPERYEAFCSGNIIKNVKAVVVPQTGGLRGIEAAVLAGGIGGDPDQELQVLNGLTDDNRDEIRRDIERGIVSVKLLESEHVLHIVVRVYAGVNDASVEIVDSHTGIGRVSKNGKLIREYSPEQSENETGEYGSLNIAEILEYADTIDLDDVRECLEQQISCNYAISNEGLNNVYGAGIGPILMENAQGNLREQAKAAAAAGSDARMNGCAMPVVINSGSGNQGITVCVPILVYAKALGVSEDKLLRALCVGNLVAIHQKSGIGKLSAFCGVTCAAAGAVAGIAYMKNENYEVISQLISNALATVGGMVCDGAKSSCAGKIAAALESAFTGYESAKRRRSYKDGEGIVKEDVEKTIESVSRMASVGMHETDLEILRIMLDS